MGGSIRVTTSVEVVDELGDVRGIYFRRHKVGTWGKEYVGLDVPPLKLPLWSIEIGIRKLIQ